MTLLFGCEDHSAESPLTSGYQASDTILDSTGRFFKIDTCTTYGIILFDSTDIVDTVFIAENEIDSINWTTTPLYIRKTNYKTFVFYIDYYDSTQNCYYLPYIIQDTIQVNYGSNPINEDIDFNYSPFDTIMFQQELGKIRNNSTGIGKILCRGNVEFIKTPDWFVYQGHSIVQGSYSFGLIEETECGKATEFSTTFAEVMASFVPLDFFFKDKTNEITFSWDCVDESETSDWIIEVKNSYGVSTRHQFKTQLVGNSCE